MKKVDREALTRAIAMVRLQSPKRCKQIDAKLKGEPWEEVGRFAAYSCQCRNLKLRSWQYPPCWMGDAEPDGDPQGYGLQSAWKLRRRLIAFGLSAYEPDPLAALDAAEQAALAGAEVPVWNPRQQKEP